MSSSSSVTDANNGGFQNLTKEQIRKLQQRYPAEFLNKYLRRMQKIPEETDLPGPLQGLYIALIKDGKVEMSMTAQDYEDNVLTPLRSFKAQKLARNMDDATARREFMEHVAVNVIRTFAPKDVKAEMKTLFGLG